MQYELFETVARVLGEDERLVAEGQLLRNRVVELARKNDAGLLARLLGHAEIKATFFTIVDGAGKAGPVTVFDTECFVRFVNNKQFLPDSYTAFENKIGLSDGDEFVSERKDIVLNWPYKDCVLEGGQTKEDTSRDEIFWNETLAPDRIHRLLDPKVFTNWKRVDAKGDKALAAFAAGEGGSLTDNLLLKGNNLLVLHSLKERFAGKVKLIYIDPPYNPPGNNNTFGYNNNFNHSTWLTFMKNRLVVAKELLTPDGVMVIAIDKNEQPYLGVLIDEVFRGYESHCVTIVHNPRGVQGTNFSYTHEYAYFVFPEGKKCIQNRKIDSEEIKPRGLRDNGGESLRTDAKNCFYPIIVDKCTNQVIDFGDVPQSSFHPSANEHKGDFVYVYPIDPQGTERKWRYARQSINEVKDLLLVTNKNGIYDIQIAKDFGMYRTVWQDKRYDANEYGTKLVKDLVPGSNFSFPKSLYSVYDVLYSVVSNDKDAIVLDYHAGSGTTAHAVLELNKEDGGNRKFILIEQMDYIETITSPRIRAVLKNNKSKDNFVYAELMPLVATYKTAVAKAKTARELAALWQEIQDKAFISYRLDEAKFAIAKKDFAALDLAEQKRFITEMLDYNQLYLNYSEILDQTHKVSTTDKKLNKEFYESRI